ncbi:MAG: O-antigen ligase family protein [Roseburia sp.]|nr:O-antigen ligase family protein [Anaeroplasma bactoclasticum]MCM1196713.1 O-antigen ligase family protein [Roseburia sp.]
MLDKILNNPKIKKLNHNPIFEELYVIFVMCIALICWKFSTLAGMVTISCIAGISLLILNDFKYIAPCSLGFLFCNGEQISDTKASIPIIICVVFFVGSLVVYMIWNGVHFRKAKHFKGMALLSISCFLPILWHRVIPNGKEFLYVMYLSYGLFLLFYFLMVSSLKEDSLHMVTLTMEYMAILLAFECGLKVLYLHTIEPSKSILEFSYYIGWGLCNEAGIMMCFGLVFIFYNMLKKEKAYQIALSFVKLGLVCIGIILTTSRGTYLFGTIETLALLIYCGIASKNRRTYFICLAVFILGALICMQCFIGIPELIHGISHNVFSDNLDANGRIELWNKGIQMWEKYPGHKIFGAGVVAEFMLFNSQSGWGEVFVVYHSTLMECLVAFGIVGFVFLLIHFYEKYKQLFVLDRTYMFILLIGYIVVDLYGLIDNTYGMYYYMLPLMMFMAALDNLPQRPNGLTEIGGGFYV